MRGLSEIVRMNEREAAAALRRRYERLRSRAIQRSDFDRAKRYDGYAADLTRFLSGEIRVFPGRRQRQAGQFEPSAGRDFAGEIKAKPRLSYPPEFVERMLRLDPRNGRLRVDLATGQPVGWWFRGRSELSESLRFPSTSWMRRQFEELLSYYQLLTERALKRQP